MNVMCTSKAPLNHFHNHTKKQGQLHQWPASQDWLSDQDSTRNNGRTMKMVFQDAETGFLVSHFLNYQQGLDSNALILSNWLSYKSWRTQDSGQRQWNRVVFMHYFAALQTSRDQFRNPCILAEDALPWLVYDPIKHLVFQQQYLGFPSKGTLKQHWWKFHFETIMVSEAKYSSEKQE